MWVLMRVDQRAMTKSEGVLVCGSGRGRLEGGNGPFPILLSRLSWGAGRD